MSGRMIARYVLECDGCKSALDGEYENSTEARAAAYAAGWRFPSRTRVNGQRSKYASDVCGSCLPTWNPDDAPAPDTWKNRRVQVEGQTS